MSGKGVVQQVKQVKSQANPKQDLEAACPSETTPLVDKKPEHHPQWWAHEVTDTFKFAILYAARVSFWVVLLSVVPLSMEGGRAFFAKYGFNVATIVCNFLFTIGPNFGATVQKAMYAITGNFWAGLMHYLLFGLMPGGSQAQWDAAFWIGSVISMAYILIFMFLDINETVRFFSLASFIGYGMKFLNPTDTTEGGFMLSWSDPMVNSLTLVVVAAIIAIVCTLLPYAVLSLETMQGYTKTLETQLQMQRWHLWAYYSGSAKSLEVKALTGSLKDIKKTLTLAQTGATTSWYECLGLGARGRSIMMVQHLLKTLKNVHTELSMLTPIADREDFSKSHTNIMAGMQDRVQDVMVRIDDLGEACVDLTNDGSLDNREKRRLARCVGSLKDAVAKLKQEHRQYHDDIKPETTGEHTFVYGILEIARSLVKYAEEQKKQEDEQRSQSGLKSLFTINISIGEQISGSIPSSSHLAWAGRNSLALIFAFWLGFFGYFPGCHPTGTTAASSTCFINEYDSAIAGTVVVLLSKFVGSTFKAGLNRVSAVVLASILGKLGWVIFGWCPLSFRLITMVVIFFVVWAGMYVAYSGGEYASLGMRVAAICAMSMLAPCSTTSMGANDYSGAQHGIIDIVLSVSIMLLVDFTLAGKPASTQAEEQIVNAMDSLSKELKEFLDDPSKMKDDFMKIVDGIKENVEAAAGIAEEAKQEPRFWRRTWRPALFAEMVDAFKKISNSILNLGQVVRASKEVQNLLADESFKEARSHIVLSVEALAELSKYLLWHTGNQVAKDMILDEKTGKELDGLRTPGKALPGQEKVFAAIDAAVKAVPKEETNDPSAFHSTPCRFSVVVELLRTVIKQTHVGQQGVLRCSHK